MLVGNNLWMNPNQEVWDLTSECGVQTIRIGGNSFDRNMPSKAQLLAWVTRIQAMGAEPIIQVAQEGTPEAAAEMVKYFSAWGNHQRHDHEQGRSSKTLYLSPEKRW